MFVFLFCNGEAEVAIRLPGVRVGRSTGGRGNAPTAPSGTRSSRRARRCRASSQRSIICRAVDASSRWSGSKRPRALPERLPSGLAEFDRAIGGGIVAGSAMLVGGDPGIGKSTLLLQVAARLASEGHCVIYVSGEESAEQVRLRAVRLGLGKAPVQLAAATSVRDILTTLGGGEPPALLVINSIQTMHSDLIEGAPGHGQPGPRLGAGADPLRQGARHRGGAGRPCHQGRHHRRPARARAYGRHRAELRGRAQPPVPHPARDEEPLRRHRRDRRVRDGGGGADAKSPTRRRCS